jgi:hypothetical protein
MEQYLTTETFIRVPKNKNEKKELPDYVEKLLHKRKFTVADMWFLQKNFNKRRARRIIFN